MKTKIFLVIFSIFCLSMFAQAQHYKSNGTPDMRFKENRTSYSSGFSSVSTSTPAVRYQSGYTRSDGVSVTPHYKTVSNTTNWDNLSTSGNVNTFTGTTGSRARDYSTEALNYGSGQTIQTGSKGGQYYINSNGNKSYVPKQPSSF